MAVYLTILLLGAAAVYLVENNSKTGWFLVAVFLFLSGAFDLGGLTSVAAALAALGLIGAVTAVSWVKRRMTRFPLFYNDLLAFDRSVFGDIAVLYWRELLAIVAACAILAAPAIWAGRSLSYNVGTWPAAALLLAGAVGIALTRHRAALDIRGWAHHRALASTFFSQAIEQRLLRTDMRHLRLADAPAEPDLATPPRAIARAPHIVLISHESTFPPSLYGFPEEDDIAGFFRGRDGGRPLMTEIFGGQSIMSSLACQTGLSTAIFGEHRFYATRFWAGRLDVSLPAFLRTHGYRTASILSVDGNWMGLGPFYMSLGFQRVLEPPSYAPPGRTAMHVERDAVMMSAAAEEIARAISAGAERSYTLVETLGNHGPHGFRKYDDARADASRAWFLAECARMGRQAPAEMAEYYARLRATVDDYHAMRARLATENPGHAFVIVHIGDHQPTLANDIAREAADRHFTTFLSVDTIGVEPAASLPGDRDEPWAIFNVDLAVALYAGLPLNGFLAGKLRLVEAGPEPDFGVGGKAYAGLVRGLMAAGLIRPA